MKHNSAPPEDLIKSIKASPYKTRPGLGKTAFVGLKSKQASNFPQPKRSFNKKQ